MERCPEVLEEPCAITAAAVTTLAHQLAVGISFWLLASILPKKKKRRALVKDVGMAGDLSGRRVQPSWSRGSGLAGRKCPGKDMGECMGISGTTKGRSIKGKPKNG